MPSNRTPDPDNPEWTAREAAQARPADRVHPPAIADQLVNKGGRPRVADADRRVPLTLRVPARVVEQLRATGPGWQTRAAEMLAKAARKSPGTMGNRKVSDLGPVPGKLSPGAVGTSRITKTSVGATDKQANRPAKVVTKSRIGAKGFDR